MRIRPKKVGSLRHTFHPSLNSLWQAPSIGRGRHLSQVNPEDPQRNLPVEPLRKFSPTVWPDIGALHWKTTAQFTGKPKTIDSFIGLVLTNALVLTGLANFQV